MQVPLIQIDDGFLVEVELDENAAHPISSGVAARVSASLNDIGPILIGACRPVISMWHELNKEMVIDQAKIELGLSFEGEGNVYITKAKAGANIIVKLTLKAPEEQKKDAKPS